VRLFGIAAADLILTVAAAVILAVVYSWSIWCTFLVLFAIGTVLHLVFSVRTAFVVALTNTIGLSACEMLMTVVVLALSTGRCT